MKTFLDIGGWPFFLALAAGLIFTPAVAFIYKSFGWLDDPQKNKHRKVIHTYPVPRGGGLAIFLSVGATSLVFLGVDKYLVGILSGLTILAIVGWLDDLFNLNPYLRLFWGVVAASLVVASGIGIAFITNPWGGVIHLSQPQISFFLLGKVRTVWLMADALAIVWIVWTMNMVNWAKGLDGQLPGVVVIAALTLALLSFRFTEDVTQWEVATLAMITAGAYLGFLPWNFYPQKIMPGYGGGAMAGYLLAVLAILSGAKLATMILVLGIPMMDGLYTLLRRLAAGKSPVWGYREHLHHKLLDLGWGKRRVTLFYWLATAFLGVIALQLNSQQKAFTIILLLLLVWGWLLWLSYFTSFSKRRDRDSG